MLFCSHASIAIPQSSRINTNNERSTSGKTADHDL